MKMLIPLMILGTLLTSCRNPDSYPRIDDIEQLSPFFVYVEIDGKKYVDVEASGCHARNYRHTRGFVGPISDAITMDLDECNRMVGYAPRTYGYYTTWKENFRVWLNNAKN